MAIPIIVVFYLLSTPLTARIGSVEAVKSESYSGGFRLLTWKGTLSMATSNPIVGTGIGTFEEAYPKYAITGFTKLAHNSYLQIAGESGFISMLFLFLILISAGIISFINLVRTDNVINRIAWISDDKLLMCGLFSGLTASCVRNAVDSDWYISSINISFWIIAGILFALINNNEVKIKKSILLSVGIISATFAILSLMFMTSELWKQSAQTQIAAGKIDEAIESYKYAIIYDPLNSEYHRRLAQIYMRNSDISASINEYKKAIKLSPKSSKAYLQLAKLYSLEDKNSDAIEYFDKAIEYDTNSPQILLAAARQYASSNMSDKAYVIYKRMIDIENSPYEKIRAMPEIIEPAYIFAHQYLAKKYESAGNLKSALDHYKKAKNRIEAYQESMKGMGEILEAGGSRDIDMEYQVDQIAPEIYEHIEYLSKQIK